MLYRINKTFDKILESIPPSVLDKMRIVNHSRLDPIIYQGNPVESIKFLVKGEISIENYFDNGNKYVYSTEKDFTMLGDIETLANKTFYMSSVFAITAVTFVTLPVDAFNQWIHEDKKFLLFVTETIARKACNVASIQGQIKYFTSEQRLLYELYLLSTESITNTGIGTINFSHLELAQRTGMSERTLNRYLSPLIKNKFIESKYRKLIIKEKGFSYIKNALQDVLSEPSL